MKSKNALRIVLGVIVGAILLMMVITKQVRFTETAIVETFGQPTKTLGAGLHFRWPVPIQEVITYDTRMQLFDTPYEQLQTIDAKSIMVGTYVCWQLNDAQEFRRNVGKDLVDVQGKLRETVRDVMSAIVGASRMEDFASAKDVKLEQMEKNILEQVSSRLKNHKYGVNVLQVRFKRIGLPENVSPTVMENMRTERLRKAQYDRSQGEAAAAAIEADANSIAAQILSFAEAKAYEIEGEGKQAAAAYYGQYGENQRFATFLRRLEFLSDTLKDGLFVLDGSQYDESFGWFRKAPTPQSVEGQKAAPTTPPAAPAMAPAMR
jgi:membrane protease subunit HflC